MISVIVPVYNAEKYLEKCLDSIVRQTYDNLEIILVDDESSDKSGEICDSWGKKDNRIRVIHQKKAGAGAARNRALDLSTGDFVAFVDSDDYLSYRMYEILMSYFNDQTDIVECEFVNVYGNNFRFEYNYSQKAKEYSTDEAMKEHILDRHFRQLIWNKLYRRKCIENIRFPEGKKIDDEFWMYQVIGKANKLIHCTCTLYAYRQQENSVMHTLTPQKRTQAIEAKKNRHKYIMRYFPNLISESYENMVMTCVYQMQVVLREGTKEEIKNVHMFCSRVLNEIKIAKKTYKRICLKQKIWIKSANISLMFTCRIRNILKIGL